MRQICTAENLKMNLEDLCEDCPVKIKITSNLENQIRRQAVERKELLPKNEYISYLKTEMKSASDAMENIYLINMNQPNDYIENRTEIYIWNKERLKILKDLYPNNEYAEEKNPKIEIIKSIDLTGRMFEKLPSTYSDKEEEDLRDHILLNLQTNLAKYSITGESFNKKGRTDILILNKNKNLFIGECKFWKGAKSISSTIDQVLKYSTWRDTTGAIIFFVRNKDIIRVLKLVESKVKEHSKYKQYKGMEDKHIFNFEFISSGNSALELKIMFYHIPK
jgi:hypothetical protein